MGISAVSIGLSGVAAGNTRLRNSAHKLAALQAKSSARAVETALDLQGSLIDILV